MVSVTEEDYYYSRQRTLTVGGSINVRLVSSLTRQELTKKNMCYYLCVVKKLNPNL